MDVLISQNHGLGDAVQFSIVLKHLRKYRPDWRVFAEMTLGKHTGFRRLCEGTFIRGQRPHNLRFDKVINLNWYEAAQGYSGVPSGKVTRSLLEEFEIQPDESLFRYQIDPESSHVNAVKNYVKTLPPSKGMVLIHYQGTSSAEKKNLSHEDIGEICRYLIRNEYLPVLLDWDQRSPLIDQRTIFNPDKTHPMWGATGTGDLATLTALISEAAFFIGVDSGPLHAAAATKTPGIGVWVKHHPIHFFELSHIKHILPKESRRYMRAKERGAAEEYFNAKYWHTTYGDVRTGIIDAIIEQMHTGVYSGNPMEKPILLQATSYDKDYYEQHKAAGLDYAAYGDWQREYGHWTADCMRWRGRNVLDVGCACGSLTRGMQENGVKAFGVDVNEHTIKLGREQWNDLPLFIGDSVNLHMFHDGKFDGIHSHQVFEHLRPDLVPFVLRELWRVSRPDATMFAVLDTEDSFNRQHRNGQHEDPTHVCIRPRSWWYNMLRLAGWDECSSEYKRDMESHVRNFLARYDWDWFVAKKRS